MKPRQAATSARCSLGSVWVAACAFGFIQTAPAAPLSVQVLGPEGKPLTDAVVGVLLNGTRTRAGPGASAEVVQRSREFQPAVTVIQVGTSVQFPNLDTVRHHVYSFSAVKRFEIRLYAGTPAAPVIFDKPGVAVLGCNIHDRMSARVVVMDTAVHSRTDSQGVVTFDLPPGAHRLQAWHAGLGENAGFAERSVVLTGTGTQLSWTLQSGQP